LRKYDLIFVDFDETLFDHAAMNRWLDGVMAGEGLIEPGAYFDTIGIYHEQLTPILRRYRHADHFSDIVKKDWAYMAGYIKTKVQSQPCQFCYPDSHDFLRRCVSSGVDTRILSFGHGDYQRFKMNMCAVLSELDLPIHIVDAPKTQFLKKHFAHLKKGALVDDKYPLDLPSNITHALIDRGDIYRGRVDDELVVYMRTLNNFDL
jgi:FMN phosphatase YigB (HAD superfamily)